MLLQPGWALVSLRTRSALCVLRMKPSAPKVEKWAEDGTYSQAIKPGF